MTESISNGDRQVLKGSAYLIGDAWSILKPLEEERDNSIHELVVL